MGEAHASACASVSGAQVCAVCDVDEARLRHVAEAHSVAARATDYRDLIGRSDVDAVIVASPDRFHAEHAVAAMEAGKHVLCEKPLALTLEHCAAIVDGMDRTGRLCMVAQVCRFAPGFVRAKELVEAGAIGEVFLAESEYAHNYAGAEGAGGWRRDPAHPREPIIGGGCHAVDLLRWVVGDVEEVSAYANHVALPEWPVDDCTVAALRFRSGAVGRLMVSIGCKRAYTMRSVFSGTRGTIVCDNTSPSLTLYTDDALYAPAEARDGHHYTVPIDVPVGLQEKAIAAEIEHFAECVAGRRPLTMDAREGARTVATCLAVVEAAHTGAPVHVTGW
jgi:UDP-N-acetylglucosamine 3-dehydrogenase